MSASSSLSLLNKVHARCNIVASVTISKRMKRYLDDAVVSVNSGCVFARRGLTRIRTGACFVEGRRVTLSVAKKCNSSCFTIVRIIVVFKLSHLTYSKTSQNVHQWCANVFSTTVTDNIEADTTCRCILDPNTITF